MSKVKSRPAVDRIARECFAVGMRLWNRTIGRVYDDALRTVKIKVSQMNILVAVEEPDVGVAARENPLERITPPARAIGQMLPLIEVSQGRSLRRAANLDK